MINIAGEKNFENKIKSYLKSIGAYFIKTHGDRFSKVGTPDIIACVNGKFVALELKGKGGKPSELQLYHLECIRLAGGYGVVSAPKEEVKRIKDYILDKIPEYCNTPVVDFEKLKKDLEEMG